MKLTILFVVSLIALTYAAPSQFNADKFSTIYKYLTCVPNLVDTISNERKCEVIWEPYRKDFLQTIDEYEMCSQFNGFNTVEK